MASSPRRGLGAGLGTLIPQNFDTSVLLEQDERIQKLSVSDIEPNPEQPRRYFDETGLQELAQSIKSHGVVQPIVVTGAPNGKYQLIAGERRWRAAKLAGLKQLPVIVRSLKELQRLEIAIVENVQREDLRPLEQAASIERLHQQFNLSYDEIAKKLGKASSTVNNIVRLLQLPAEAQAALNTKTITEGHARAILALKGQAAVQAELLAAIIEHGWSVRQAERFVTSLKTDQLEAKSPAQRVETETPQTKALGRRLKAPVHIKRTAKGGRLEIGFSSEAELARLIELLSKTV